MMRVVFILLVLFSCFTFTAWAEEPSSTGEKAARDSGYLEALDTAIENAYSELGHNVPTQLSRFCSLEDGNLSWWIEVYDEEGYLIAADSFESAAGLSIRFLFDTSAKNVAERSILLFTSANPRTELWESNLVFTSNDEDAHVFLGSQGIGRELGQIRDGKLSSPYIPLIKGESYYIQTTKEGYWPSETMITKKMEGKNIRLTALMKRTKKAVSAIYGLDRAMGGTLSLRRYFSEDSSYARIDLGGWVQYDGEDGSLPVYHQELRLAFGLLYPKREQNTFRLGFGSSISVFDTYFLSTAGIDLNNNIDLCIDPLFLSMELHSPHWALILEQRFIYSFGLQSGYLNQGWLKGQTLGPLHFSLGILHKW